MRVLQVLPRFNPRLGGVVNFVSNLSEFLVSKDHEVTILTTTRYYDKDYADTIQKKGIEVIPFPYLADIGLFILSPGINDWLKKNLKYFDVIHLNGARSYQNNAVYKYSKNFNIPYVIQAHGSAQRIVEKITLKKIYDIVWGYKLLSGSEKLIALHQSEANAYKKMGIKSDKIVTIPTGVDLSKFSSFPKKGEFREIYSLNSERIILYVGRLHKSKGLELLIDAFSDLLKYDNNLLLVLLGPDDGLKSTLQKKVQTLGISTKVIFTGHVSELEKARAFIDADVFVTPKFYGLPVTFAESCAYGLPIVITRGGDEIEWIHENIGYVTDYDLDQFKDAIFKLIMEKKERDKFSTNAKYLVQNDFNWIKVAQRIEDLYKDIAEP